MRVIAAGPTLTPGRAAAGRVEFVTLDDLFPRADAVFICTRISDLTRGLVTRRHLEMTRCTSRARALYADGVFARRHGDMDAADRSLNECLTLVQAAGDQAASAAVLFERGEAARYRSQFTRARGDLEAALALRRALGDQTGTAEVLTALGYLASRVSDFDTARRHLQESLAIQRDLGHVTGIAEALDGLGFVAEAQDDLDAAQQNYEQGLAHWRELGDVARASACSSPGASQADGAILQPPTVISERH